MAQALPAGNQPAVDSKQADKPAQPGKVVSMDAARKEKTGDVPIEVLTLFFM